MLQSLPEENIALTDHSGILNGGSGFEKDIEIKEPAKVLSNNDEERKIKQLDRLDRFRETEQHNEERKEQTLDKYWFQSVKPLPRNKNLQVARNT